MALPAQQVASMPTIVEFTSGVPTVADIFQQDRRLRLLQILCAAPAYLANEAVLKRALVTLGHAPSSDLLRTELAWLDEQGLIEMRQAAGMYVARLLERGQDVIRGTVKQPGIAPGD